ncbi:MULTISPECIES: hypothetical protein [unclassified Mesorhizobium]|uniref:hypothetical protein n=1 Tax=unclassified Mesorhizobium TaxID=325217 RepID=UPI001CCEB93C|nr:MULTISPECIES: hypothetical protein [unclassified Mesorhizobium]MBZ9739733.1 hypothetical protein [Mesorhizobium sp. CO1-1-4]MBZ9805003.1 hypothetical protein [Mesorhizobium sp. ES1-6]
MASLRARMQAAKIAQGKLMTCRESRRDHRDGLARIDGDELIAASFVNDLSPGNVADHADTQQTF